MQKAFAKAKNVIDKEGKTPTFYIRSLVEMEDFISQVSSTPHCQPMHSALIMYYVILASSRAVAITTILCLLLAVGRQRSEG